MFSFKFTERSFLWSNFLFDSFYQDLIDIEFALWIISTDRLRDSCLLLYNFRAIFIISGVAFISIYVVEHISIKNR